MRRLLRKIKRYLKVLIGLDIWPRIQTKCSVESAGSEHSNWDFNPDTLNSESIVYSFGVGEDISFDLALIDRFGVTVHAFDPTPRSIQWVKEQNTPSKFKMYDYGIASFDGETLLYPPDNPDYVSHSVLRQGVSTQNQAINVQMFRLSTITKKLQHFRIDLLKMNIEGAEYDVISDILTSKINIEQILIEFHHRFEGVGIQKTKDAISSLNQAGYKKFSISDNGQQYSFIKE